MELFALVFLLFVKYFKPIAKKNGKTNCDIFATFSITQVLYWVTELIAAFCYQSDDMKNKYITPPGEIEATIVAFTVNTLMPQRHDGL